MAPDSIEPDALKRLTEHTWPGNIRELRNVIRSAFAICDDNVIRVCDLPAQLGTDCGTPTAARTAAEATPPGTPASSGAGNEHRAPALNPLAHAEREALLSAIRASRGNLCHTAKQLGISRNSLYRKLKRHGIAISRVDGLSIRQSTDR
jgi:transcriptional regulator of acetoin/glycerol metabolism